MGNNSATQTYYPVATSVVADTSMIVAEAYAVESNIQVSSQPSSAQKNKRVMFLSLELILSELIIDSLFRTYNNCRPVLPFLNVFEPINSNISIYATKRCTHLAELKHCLRKILDINTRFKFDRVVVLSSNSNDSYAIYLTHLVNSELVDACNVELLRQSRPDNTVPICQFHSWFTSSFPKNIYIRECPNVKNCNFDFPPAPRLSIKSSKSSFPPMPSAPPMPSDMAITKDNTIKKTNHTVTLSPQINSVQPMPSAPPLPSDTTLSEDVILKETDYTSKIEQEFISNKKKLFGKFISKSSEMYKDNKDDFKDHYEMGLRQGIDNCNLSLVSNMLKTGNLDKLDILKSELNYVNKRIAERKCNKTRFKIKNLLEKRIEYLLSL